MRAEAPIDRIWHWLTGGGRASTQLGWLSCILGVGFAAFVLGIFLLAIAMPVYVYDQIPYIGAALAQSGVEAASLHEQTWSTAKALTSEADYLDLSQGYDYRKRQSSDPQAFASVLPLYSAKLGYIALLQLAPGAQAMAKLALWAGHLGALAIGITCLFWMVAKRTLWAAPILAAVLVLGSYFESARGGGPDIIASALVLIGVYVWLQQRDWLANGLWLAAFLFRPDTIILLLALIITSFLFGHRKLPTLLAFGVALGLSVIIQKSTGHPGWWVHYYFSNIRIQPTLVGFDPAFSVQLWARGMGRGIYQSLLEFNWPAVLVLLSGMTVWLWTKRHYFADRQRAALGFLLLTIGGKFALFPLPDDRIYSIFLVAAVLILAEIAIHQSPARSSSSPDRI